MTILRRLAAALAAGAVAIALLPATATVTSAAPDPRAGTRVDWRAVTLKSPYPDAGAESRDIECIGRTCLILGLIGDERSGAPYLTTLTGRTSKTALISKVPGTTGRALSCPTTDWCMVVGSVYTKAPSDRTWAASYSGGKWTTHKTPTPTNGLKGQGYLSGVSCTSSTWCAAVGWYFDPDGNAQGLLLTWDGKSWTRVEKSATRARFIPAIDCVSPQHCVLVGSTQAGPASIQIRRWTPSGWSRVAGAPAGTDGFTASVSCESMKSCLITARKDSETPVLLRTSNRTARKIALPNGPGRPFELRSVSCDPTGTCFAVGAVMQQANDRATSSIAQISPSDQVTLSRPYRNFTQGSALMAIDCDVRCVATGQGASDADPFTTFALIQRPTPGR